ncbi:MAG: hypothetical protein KDD38_10645, partial [Bdellovibrionales bacterium]|nr:hypothetical protein [Bdellovibrionales bacterium]
EAARQEFIKERKAKPKEDTTSWEKELVEQKRQHEIERKAFVKRRDEMNRILNSVGQIPEEDEYDIDLDYVEE